MAIASRQIGRGRGESAILFAILVLGLLALPISRARPRISGVLVAAPSQMEVVAGGGRGKRAAAPRLMFPHTPHARLGEGCLEIRYYADCICRHWFRLVCGPHTR